MTCVTAMQCNLRDGFSHEYLLRYNGQSRLGVGSKRVISFASISFNKHRNCVTVNEPKCSFIEVIPSG